MTRTETVDKPNLRERSRSIRDGIDPVRRLELSEAIHDRLYELPPFRDANAVATYFSTGSEVLTGPLSVRLAEQEGKRLLLPFVLNDELQLTEWRPTDPVVDAPYGGVQPRYRRPAPLDDVDVIVVPGLAFDRTGARLGEGTGLLDGLLGRLPAHTYRIGLAFGEQIATVIPMEPGDERVHMVATDAEVIDCAAASTTSF